MSENLAPETEKSIGTGWIIGVLLLVSAIIGVYSFELFRSSRRYLNEALTNIRKRGHVLSTQQCIEEVLSFRRNCRSMAKLCDSLVPRAMGLCLEQKSRLKYCRALPTSTARTTFGAKDCKRRQKEGATRALYNACGTSYRMIDAHCHRELDPKLRRSLPFYRDRKDTEG
ncbi:MAG: hypothetical protein KC609_12870 [Myxococcales bacterium]|nr:hypothetical protein [Myxococcales bacterium]